MLFRLCLCSLMEILVNTLIIPVFQKMKLSIRACSHILLMAKGGCESRTLDFRNHGLEEIMFLCFSMTDFFSPAWEEHNLFVFYLPVSHVCSFSDGSSIWTVVMRIREASQGNTYFGGLLLYLFNSTEAILVVIKEISERWSSDASGGFRSMKTNFWQ